VEKEVRTLTLKARMPVLQGWDAQGLHWQDLPLPDDERCRARPTRFTSPVRAGSGASAGGGADLAACCRRALRQGMNGLWLRIQDLRYAEALLGQDDCPWKS
jgi:hypothetical protein